MTSPPTSKGKGRRFHGWNRNPVLALKGVYSFETAVTLHIRAEDRSEPSLKSFCGHGVISLEVYYGNTGDKGFKVFWLGMELITDTMIGKSSEMLALGRFWEIFFIILPEGYIQRIVN